jgi:hypothetical protein
MDRFVTLHRKKEDEIIGRDEYIKNIRSLLETNASFCVYGRPGVGKTFLISHALQGFNYIELTQDILKSKRLQDVCIHVLVEEMDVFEPVSLGSTIVVSDGPVENFDCIRVEPLSLQDMVLLGKNKFPKLADNLIHHHAKESNGDVRTFLFRLDGFACSRDVFKSPKDFVYDLVCSGGSLDPSAYVGKHVMEHGYSWGIIHENYLDAPGASLEKIADMMSIADLKDEEMYNGYSSGNIFSLFGIVLPAIEISHSLERSSMRPGSAWTKFNNYKMRFRRYNDLKIRSGMDIDKLMVLSQYCKSCPIADVLPMLQHYGIESADMDMMNHLSLIHKLKPRVLQNIKNKLKSLCK